MMMYEIEYHSTWGVSSSILSSIFSLNANVLVLVLRHAQQRPVHRCRGALSAGAVAAATVAPTSPPSPLSVDDLELVFCVFFAFVSGCALLSRTRLSALSVLSRPLPVALVLPAR